MVFIMPSLRKILVWLPIAATLVLAQPEPRPGAAAVANDISFDFQELLNAIPEESIHAALHKLLETKYQDGVYEHDRSAVEAVRNEDPPTATKLLVGAALDLIKRQNGNSSAPATTSAAPVPTTTSSTAVVVPVVVSTTDSSGSTIVQTTSAVAEASVSVAVAVTTTNSRGSTVTSSSTVAAAVVTADNGRVTTSAVPTFKPATVNPTSKTDVTTTDRTGNTVVLSQVSLGQVVTTTNARGSTLVTTYTPQEVHISSIVLQTTTLPNGEQSVVTSFADVQLMTETAGGSAGATSSVPRLQNGGASLRSQGFAPIFGAAVGGAVWLAVFL